MKQKGERLSGEKKNLGGLAFLPLLVFLALYIGTGVILSILGAESTFGAFPRHVALLAGFAVAMLMSTGDTIQEKTDKFCEHMGNSGVMQVILIYLLARIIVERNEKSISMAKILGFRDRKLGHLLISQNVWLSVLGVVIGLPAGVGVLQWLLMALAGEYELKLMLGPATYLVSVLLTFGVSLAVGLLVARKSRRIDMVEALKGAE